MTVQPKRRSYTVTELERCVGTALRHARAGDVVTITANGRIVAQIVPVSPQVNSRAEEIARLVRGEALLKDEIDASLDLQGWTP